MIKGQGLNKEFPKFGVQTVIKWFSWKIAKWSLNSYNIQTSPCTQKTWKMQWRSINSGFCAWWKRLKIGMKMHNNNINISIGLYQLITPKPKIWIEFLMTFAGNNMPEEHSIKTGKLDFQKLPILTRCQLLFELNWVSVSMQLESSEMVQYRDRTRLICGRCSKQSVMDKSIDWPELVVVFGGFWVVLVD